MKLMLSAFDNTIPSQQEVMSHFQPPPRRARRRRQRERAPVQPGVPDGRLTVRAGQRRMELRQDGGARLCRQGGLQVSQCARQFKVSNALR